VLARHDDGPCLGRDLGTQCQHEHDTKHVAHKHDNNPSNTIAARLNNTIAAH
jgi:hypothetical protein